MQEVKTPLIACHRGIMKEFQENTADGIVRAIEYKINIVDLDVMVTKYGDIVCSHDENVKDLIIGHQDCFIKTLTKEEISKLIIDDKVYNGDKIIEYKTKNRFCFLDDVFKLYSSDIMFWIDIKDKDYRPWKGKCLTADVIANFVINNSDKVKQMIIGSTNPFVIYYIRKRLKKFDFYKDLVIGCDYGPTKTCILNLVIKSGFMEWLLGYNFVAAGRDYITQKFIDSRNKKNIKVMPYVWVPDERVEFTNLHWYLVEY